MIRHSLTLEFGRVLSEAEWREVIELARKIPYVRGLAANADTKDLHVERRSTDVVDLTGKEPLPPGHPERGGFL